MKKENKNKSVVLFLRISDLWNTAIKQIAQAEMRTKNSVAKQAIKEFLKRKKGIR